MVSPVQNAKRVAASFCAFASRHLCACLCLDSATDSILILAPLFLFAYGQQNASWFSVALL